MQNKTMTVQELEQIMETANLAGKKLKLIALQLNANEMGAPVAVPALGIEEGTPLGKTQKAKLT